MQVVGSHGRLCDKEWLFKYKRTIIPEGLRSRPGIDDCYRKGGGEKECASTRILTLLDIGLFFSGCLTNQIWPEGHWPLLGIKMIFMHVTYVHSLNCILSKQMHLQHVITIKDATTVARESSNPTLQERIHDIMKVRSEQNSGCFWVCGMVGTHQFVDVILGHVFTWTFNLDCMTTLHIWLRVHWLWDDQASSILASLHAIMSLEIHVFFPHFLDDFLICFGICIKRNHQVLMVRIEQFVIEVILCFDPSFSIEIGDEVQQVVCFLQLQT